MFRAQKRGVGWIESLNYSLFFLILFLFISKDPRIYSLLLKYHHIFLFFSLISFYYTFKYFIYERKLEDTPLSKTRSAAQGYVALKGAVQKIPKITVRSPLTNKECIWYKYNISKRVGKDGWKLIETNQSGEMFILKDETGTCYVNPINADITCDKYLSWYGHTAKPVIPSNLKTPMEINSNQTIISNPTNNGLYHYEEYTILENDNLYVMGMFHTIRHDIQPIEDMNESTELYQAQILNKLQKWGEEFQSCIIDHNDNKKNDIPNQNHTENFSLTETTNHSTEENSEESQKADEGETINLLSEHGLPKNSVYIISTLEPDAIPAQYRFLSVANLILFLCYTAVAFNFESIFQINH